MDLSTVAKELHLQPDEVSALKPEWAASQRHFPAEGPEFLQPAQVGHLCRQSFISDDIAVTAQKYAQKVTSSKALTALAWHLHYCLFEESAYDWSNLRSWPVLNGMFYVLGLLSGIPALRRFYDERRLPEGVIKDTLSNIDLRIRRHKKDVGHFGLTPGSVGGWFTHHLHGRLYHLERLQFVPNSFGGCIHVFRHRTSGEVLALSKPGVKYRADGFLDGVDDVFDIVGAWTATLEVTKSEVVGYPVLPFGWATRSPRRLPTSQWEQVLAPGDPVLQVHIPATGPLDFAESGRSLAEAERFFPRYFPEWPFAAFACDSWLLDNQITSLLPSNANIPLFTSEAYLYPTNGNKAAALRWVFGSVPPDLAQAPRDTSLRRAMLDHFLAGGEWHFGGGIWLPGVPWGRQFYRKQSWVYEAMTEVDRD